MACTLPLEASNYSCDGKPKTPPEGAVYTPYVRLEFGDGNVLTGGNNSSPDTNLAAITSFEYGFGSGTQGWGMNIEAIDNGGAMYRKILRSINKTIVKIPDEVSNVEVDFGWIIKNCDGSVTTDFASKIHKLYGIFFKCDMTFESGNVKMKIEIRAPSSKSADVRHAEPFGTEDGKVYLRDALIELFTERHPRFQEVEFIDQYGFPDFEFKNFGYEGPPNVWPCDQEDSFAIARKWLNGIVTQDDRGIVIGYESGAVNVIIQEDPEDGCCPKSRYLGTYVVNGGNCSPVISFNPTIAWDKGYIPGGGGATGGASTGDFGEFAEPENNIEKAGTQTSIAAEQNQWNFRNPEDQSDEANNALSAHEHAEGKTINGPVKGWEADLKIIGDPAFIDLPEMMGATLGIVFINPFYIDECVWIQRPMVNSMLSNKNYMVVGITHQISAGSFTTNFKLRLTIPNVDLDFDAPLGECGTETMDGEGGLGESTTGDANGNG
jgi:hypothetical protein